MTRAFCFLLLACAFAWPAHAQMQPTSAPSDRSAAKLYGSTFSVSAPRGWFEVPADTSRTVRVFLRSSPEWQKADGMIKVDVGKSSAPTPRDLAAKFAGADGKVLPGSVMVDGIEAAKAETTGRDLSNPRYGVVVFKDGRAYVIMGAATNDKDISRDLDEFVASWRWPRGQAPAVEAPPLVEPPMVAPPMARRGGDVLETMKGRFTREPDGTVVLTNHQRITTPETFQPPVTFRMVVWTQNNDVRFAYAADQIIFNWEMRPTQLRVDGGPANRQHKDGAGALPENQWVEIQWTVKKDMMLIHVDGKQRYVAHGDFSQIDKPLSLTAHRGTMKVKQVVVSPFGQ